MRYSGSARGASPSRRPSSPTPRYSGCRLNVARLGDATFSPVLHQGFGSPENFALRDLARRATIRLVLHYAYATLAYIHWKSPGQSTEVPFLL